MGEKLMRDTAVLGMVRAMLKGRTVRDVAREIGVSPAFLHSIVQGNKPLGKIVPRFFDLEPVVLYEWRRRARPKE